MANWYSSRELVKKAAGISGGDRDSLVDEHIASASREIDQLTNRRFIPITATRSYDWPDRNYRKSYEIHLDEDLLSVSALTKEGDDVTAIASTDFFLEPRNQTPYQWIEIDLASTAFFSAKDTHQRQIRVTGSWGYSNATKAAGATAEDMTAAETDMDVTDSSLIDVGDTLLVGTEQMFVSGKALLDSTANLNGDLTATTSQTAVTVTNGALVKRGEIITLDSERMLVESISGNVLTVVRAYDGSTLAAHTGAVDVYAPRTLTVTRGENGTTAATSSSGAAITKYTPPADISGLCRALAVAYFMAEQGGWTGMIGAGAEVNTESRMAALMRRKEQVKAKYQRRLLGAV